MPPFQLPERIVTLAFEDGPLKGLELEVRLNLPFDFYFELNNLADKSAADSGLDTYRTLLRRFAELALIGWNLTDRAGQPVPCNPDAFTATVDPINGSLMLRRYMESVGGVADPLAAPSANGRTSKARKASSSRAS